MSPLFGRRRDRGQDDAAPQSPAPAAPVVGPFDADADEVPTGRRVDLGCLRVPVVEGSQLQLEIDRTTKVPRSASVVLGPSRVRLSAYAAPRSQGVWDDVRQEITAEVTKVGGTAREITGEFGTEVLTTLPARLPDGRQALQVQRFVGVDGPRWFLRAVFVGPEVVRAAGIVVPEGTADDDRLHSLEEVVRGVVVVRGGQARPPREPLPMTVPTVQTAPGAVQTAEAPAPTDGTIA